MNGPRPRGGRPGRALAALLRASGSTQLAILGCALLAAAAAGAVASGDEELGGPATAAGPHARAAPTPTRPAARGRHGRLPTLRDTVYGAAATTRLEPRLRGIRPRVYVPNTISGTVVEIDPRTFREIRSFPVGRMPQHITPSWGLRHLYVNNNESDSLTVIDPRTGRPGRTIPVTDPYNLYFTPDGRHAIVVAEAERRLDIRNPRTWRLTGSVSIPYPGIDHLDFSANGRYLIASTEFSGMVVRINLRKKRVTGAARVGGLPVDVKLSPDGRIFYVANQGRDGVSIVDARRLREVGFLHTGRGAHGLCVSRNARRLYVSNRLGGSISVVDLRRRRVVRTWRTGGSPDMLQVSPNGRRLWTSDRYDGTVTVVDTRSGRVVKRIRVGAGPHGLAYFPQPGRYSVGHNGVYR
jgi:YVTN family beta-propeller protein